MGSGGVTAAVTDAGPLIHLVEIGCLALLQVFETLHVPDAVWSETVEMNRVAQLDILKLGIVQRHSLSEPEVSEFIQQNNLTGLHSGERECIYLCRRLNVATLLTDDLAVREAAKRQNLTPVGSLGIVIRAYRLGKISLIDAERYINSLYSVSSLFVTRAIVDMAIEELHKRSRQD